MKTCPVCHARCFDDMEVCFGCLHDFSKQSVHGQDDGIPDDLEGFAELEDIKRSDARTSEASPPKPFGEAAATAGRASISAAETALLPNASTQAPHSKGAEQAGAGGGAGGTKACAPSVQPVERGQRSACSRIEPPGACQTGLALGTPIEAPQGYRIVLRLEPV